MTKSQTNIREIRSPIVAQAIQAGRIPELDGFASLRRDGGATGYCHRVPTCGAKWRRRRITPRSRDQPGRLVLMAEAFR